ncbi:dihydroorotate dehydrogenase 2 [Buchnera aphidicola str. JF99 (Acyrthosiphon pisum)]|nr:dihydroorotate dehydrogenase 2 [Buchnera aphidicola str. LL01 (Acyrthosiphon pisum)]ADP66755.1 dihydroorotate dehydrogenase 2 [Buchnera aphidicola str. TLW03 (Acyrthosiphon pisum)]ADP67338.1 dihydroorotate dehydrogenase 2 [Buchnera aphidicola str. JF99 (Acyrthosiphon pisum)]ADP67855.1 dihydroorotate dehydrogenase 2 [Buchnera aphidicola str. JF98 (Acyrthosiphon pisum)]
MGLIFDNKLGTAAGIDKNGEYIDALSKLGFGFIEVGTVTPLPQVGNPKPRMFRIVSMEGIINRMGFNNLGIDNLIRNIKKSNFKGIIGVNIGKNKSTSLENSVDDYLICIEKIYCYAGYIAINISSPNTTNLRNLQYGILFKKLLYKIKKNKKNFIKNI